MTAANGAVVLGRVDRVQRFILASPRLRQIRGGSALLVEMEGDAREILGEEAVAAGGMVLARVARDEAEARARALRLRYALRAPGAQFRAVHAPLDHERFRESLDAALEKLAGEPGPVEPPPDVPFALSCDVCRVRPARELLPPQGDEGGLRACLECRARHDANERLRPRPHGGPVPVRHRTAVADLFARLGERVADPDHPERPARVIEDVARGRPRGYVGYLAADGNDVGGRVRALETFEEYREFASRLNEATRDALLAAAETCSASESSLLPVVAGGDDLLLFSAPGLAVPLAVEFAAAFERLAATGAGVGVVIAHWTTPFGVLDELAHRLQKRAKALARTAGGTSAIGFAILHGGEDVEPPAVRGRRLGVGTYLVDDGVAGLDARRLVEHARAIQRASPPWSRLKRVSEVLSRFDDPRATHEYELILKPLPADLRATLGLAALPPAGYDPGRTAPWIVHRETHRVATAVPDALALAEIL